MYNIYNLLYIIYNIVLHSVLFFFLSGMKYDFLLILKIIHCVGYQQFLLCIHVGIQKFMFYHVTLHTNFGFFLTLRIKNIKMQPSTYVTDINYVHNFRNACLVL